MSLESLPVDELQRLAEAEDGVASQRGDAIDELVRRVNAAERKIASNERCFVCVFPLSTYISNHRAVCTVVYRSRSIGCGPK